MDYILQFVCVCVCVCERDTNPEHKTSFKSLGYICSNSQKYIVWVKIIISFFNAKTH